MSSDESSICSIELKGVELSFPPKRIFKGFTHTFRAGSVIGLFGPNGCGKSCLLQLIAGLIDPDRGSITYNGELSRPRVGFLFQSAQESLFPWMTVRENLEFAARRTRNEPIADLT